MKNKTMTTGSYCAECGIWIAPYDKEKLVLIGGTYHMGCTPKHFQLTLALKDGLTVN
jgi:hypothetical protein